MNNLEAYIDKAPAYPSDNQWQKIRESAAGRPNVGKLAWEPGYKKSFAFFPAWTSEIKHFTKVSCKSCHKNFRSGHSFLFHIINHFMRLFPASPEEAEIRSKKYGLVKYVPLETWLFRYELTGLVQGFPLETFGLWDYKLDSLKA